MVEVAKRLGMSDKRLYLWVRLAQQQQCGQWRKRTSQDRSVPTQGGAQKGQRGASHPRKGRHVLCQAVRVKYAFVAEHQSQFRLSSMCRVLHIQPKPDAPDFEVSDCNR